MPDLKNRNKEKLPENCSNIEIERIETMKPVFFPCCIWIVFTHAVTLAIAICLLYFCIPFQFPFSKRYPIDVLGTNLCA